MNAPVKTDANPYAPVEPTESPRREPLGRRSRWKLVLTGLLWSVVSAFPIAGLMALVFRFPVPFVGYRSGVDAILPAMLAVLIYGIPLGGLFLVGFLGAVGGLLLPLIFGAEPPIIKWLVRVWALLVTSSALLLLAVLDKIIGPW